MTSSTPYSTPYSALPSTGPLFDPRLEREIGQRRAVAELLAIVDACRGLPPVAWTVATCGATLAGRVTRASATTDDAGDAGVAQDFHVWRQTLGLTLIRPVTERISTHLSATGLRNGVRVHLSATVFHDEDTGHDTGHDEGNGR